MRISEYFNLNRKQNELDFVDIDIENDTPLFLDPYFLSTREDRWSRETTSTLNNFFNHILTLFENNKIEEAKANFRFTEPYETCLGLSKSGIKGKGIGEGEATKLFHYILESKAIDEGIVTSINEMKIFIENISHDKISDLCTNVVRKHLVDYTKRQCELYNIELQKDVASNPYWSPEKEEWIVSYEEMLVINEKPILLVPKSIVCRKEGYFYSSEMYARHYVLNFLVSEEKRLGTNLVKKRKLKSGRIKEEVIKSEVAEKYDAYNKESLRKFTKKHPEYFEKFKADARNNLKSLSNEEILENHNEQFYMNIIENLIEEFKSIQGGKDEANKYHNHILACMNFIFYPQLINPVKENSINEGRKRIDLTYDNAAEKGYFNDLHSKFELPSPYIFIECKNFTKELGNPELDQLNGRFSPNRGKVGIITFRSCEDEELLYKRCTDFYRENKNLILPLQDEDFISILQQLKVRDYEKDIKPHENILRDKTRKIILA